MTDLTVSPAGLRATAGTLGGHAAESAVATTGVAGPGSQVSIAAVQGVAAHMRSWHTDESGYHGAMAETLTSASRGYETADEQGARTIGGGM